MIENDAWFEDEVRDGFYVPALIKRDWGALLKLLDRFSAFCREHGLRWFLAYGSLLGAVRHRGFIPWDDDIDLYMPRSDLLRFAQLLREKDVGMTALGPCDLDDLSDEGGRVLYWRVYPQKVEPLLPQEKWVENCGFPITPHLEVFPLDKLSPVEEREEYRKQMIRIALDTLGLARVVEFDRQHGNSQYDHREHIAALEMGVRTLETHVEGFSLASGEPVYLQMMALADRLSGQFEALDDSVARECAVMFYHVDWGTKPYPAAAFRESIFLDFEGESLPCPAGWEQVLAVEFGDWKKRVKSGGDHGYPAFGAALKRLESGFPHWPFRYVFSGFSSNCSPGKKEAAGQALALLRQARFLLGRAMGGGDAAAAAVGMALELCQQAAIRLGAELENNARGGMPETVETLESFCENIYRLALMLSDV